MLSFEPVISIVLCIGIVRYAIWLLARVARLRATKGVLKTELSRVTRVVLMVFGVGFSAISLVGVIVGIMEIVIPNETKSWLTAPGQVVESHRVSCGKFGTCGHLRYVYYVNDEKFEGGSVSGVWSTLGTGLRDIEKYPLGTSVRVYYDLKDPSKALLEPGKTVARTGWWAVVISGIFLLAGIVLLLVAFGKILVGNIKMT